MYRNIDKDLEQASGGDVVRKRKSLVTPVIITAVGLLIAFMHYFVPAVADNGNLSSGTMIVGWSAVIFGLIRIGIILGMGSSDYYYAPTGAKLRRYEFSYEAAHRDRVREYAIDGRMDKLAGVPRSTISAVKLTLYAIPGKDVLWSQVFEFIPHNHVPVTEVIAYAPGSCQMPRQMA